jgi:hypothetical protein
MSSKFSMMKRVAVAAALAVGVSGAFATNSIAQTKAQSFAEQNAEWTRLSEGMPSGSPAVDRSVGPADPVPAVHDRAGEIARFRQMDAQLQAESTDMPSGSPRVDKNEPAADPIPKATTLAEKEARFAAEDRFLQSMSTH